MRVILGKMACDMLGIDDRYMLRTSESGLPRKSLNRFSIPIFSHSTSSFTMGLSWDLLEQHAPDVRQRRILFLARNPLDVTISYYFYVANSGKESYLRRFRGMEFSDFLRHPKIGIKKVVAFYNSFESLGRQASAFKVVTYEDMLADPAQVISCVIDFLGWDHVPKEEIDSAIKFASKDNMKKMESESYLQGFFTGRVTWANSIKDGRKKASVGTSKKILLSKEDEVYVQKQMANLKWKYWIST